MALTELEKFLDEHAVQVFSVPQRRYPLPRRLLPRRLGSDAVMPRFDTKADIHDLGLKYPGSIAGAHEVYDRARRLGMEPKYWQMSHEDAEKLERDLMEKFLRAERAAPDYAVPVSLFGLEIRTA